MRKDGRKTAALAWLLALLAVGATGCRTRGAGPGRDDRGIPACPEDATPWVKLVDATHCEAPRALLVGGEGCLVAEPRVRPFRNDAGATVGFVSDAVARKSAFGLCGLRGGDVWLSVNGAPLTSPEAALAAHDALLHAPTVALELLRGATRVRLTIVAR